MMMTRNIVSSRPRKRRRRWRRSTASSNHIWAPTRGPDFVGFGVLSRDVFNVIMPQLKIPDRRALGERTFWNCTKSSARARRRLAIVILVIAV